MSARDADACTVSGILVEWAAAADWGADASGVACATGRYELWRAPESDPLAERNVASGLSGTSFVDRAAVPGRAYAYRVLAANDSLFTYGRLPISLFPMTTKVNES